jgi:ribose transport system ATP-binding protein
VGLSGLVGAGRTEVAKAIFGYDPIESGSVYYYGKKYRKLNTSLTTRLKVGFIPENRKEEGAVIEMPIWQNIVHASLKRLFKYHLINRKIEIETAQKYQGELGIVAPSINKVLKFLSGGNQQKTIVAKWVCAECDFMIFDEPTRGIDVGARTEIYQIINELVSRGKAILLISSDMTELLGLCDRIYVMKDGRITAEFSRNEATQEKIMACCV